jgi:DNA processing protein
MQKPQTTPPISIIERDSQHYPTRLNDLFDPPKLIYIKGGIHLLTMPMVAVVGSRNPSAEGLYNAQLFTKGLSKAGILILSGMARGVDGQAHRACLSLGPSQFTAAVFGTGLDVIYPSEFSGLAESISLQGLLLSEFPPGTGPKACHFPKRNRIIAALALGVLVIEAAERSGSLITARLAADLGREVFAVPGSIRNPLTRGCHLLIQQGAKLVRNPDEVLEELHLWPKTPFKWP